MSNNDAYKRYNLLLDPKDPDEKKLIVFLEKIHTNKKKGSYSAILRMAVKALMEKENKI